MKNKKAFTLLEILLAVAALVILAGIVILAINPSKQLADTRNAERWMEVNQILNAVYQYSIDHSGDFPADMPAAAREMCIDTAGCDALTDVDLYDDLVSTYIVGMPVEPRINTTANPTHTETGYTIYRDAGTGRITVAAPSAEGVTISVTR